MNLSKKFVMFMMLVFILALLSGCFFEKSDVDMETKAMEAVNNYLSALEN